MKPDLEWQPVMFAGQPQTFTGEPIWRLAGTRYRIWKLTDGWCVCAITGLEEAPLSFEVIGQGATLRQAARYVEDRV